MGTENLIAQCDMTTQGILLMGFVIGCLITGLIFWIIKWRIKNGK